MNGFKHLKSLKKIMQSFSKPFVFKFKTNLNVYDRVNMPNEFFQSFFSPKISIDIKENDPENQEMSNFSASKVSLRNFLLTIDPKKSRGPDALPPLCYQKTFKEIVNCLN